jgi:hypothetical protein
MGAWGHGILDDDSALDFLSVIQNTEDPKGDFKAAFLHAINSDYLEYDQCHEVTVSAALMDNLLNGTQYGEEDYINTFGEKYKGPPVDELRSYAVKALHRVIGDKSELNELWSENEELYPKWRQNIEELATRLS